MMPVPFLNISNSFVVPLPFVSVAQIHGLVIGHWCKAVLLVSSTFLTKQNVRFWQITPYMREIYIIQMIKQKILEHCLAVAGQ